MSISTNEKGINNIFIGSETGKESKLTNDNVFIGNKSGMNNTRGKNNVFIGSETGKESISTSDNVFIGNNCFIGARALVSKNLKNKSVVISPADTKHKLNSKYNKHNNKQNKHNSKQYKHNSRHNTWFSTPK